MGDVGTDVAKEAADTVLRDDNFATIVAAVREGRIVYDNIRKFIKYTMTSNSGEIWVMLLAPFALMDLPLLPLQILWINLVTDGLPGLALAVEPGERDTMHRPPYPPNEHVFSRGMWQHILFVGLLMGIISLGAGYFYWNPETPEDPYWRTMVFMVLTMSQMGHALVTRSGRDSIFKIGFLSNKAMLGAVTLTLVLQLAVVYLKPLQGIFHTTGLSLRDLVISLLLSSVVFWCVEVSKWIRARRPQHEAVAASNA
jgi:Ca2+-transporting ATPase